MSATAPGPDGQDRCAWCLATPGYIAYHDREWGFPVADDIRLFEKLTLESFQSGLSWRTILEKRDGFRAGFAGFDFHKVAMFDEGDVARLLADKGIVRHRGKIEAAITNARQVCALVDEVGSFAAWLWAFEPDDPEPHQGLTVSPLAQDMSKALKKRGFKFVGPTTVHAFAQAMGLINDHAPGCIAHGAVQAARAAFRKPLWNPAP
jgi:DNA-3-methyladenine glycosylase I